MNKTFVKAVIGVLILGFVVYIIVFLLKEAQPETEELWVLRSCSVITYKLYNKTFHGEMGRWDKICGLMQTCKKDCTYLPDSCRTNSTYCFEPKSSGGGGKELTIQEENLKLRNELLRQQIIHYKI